MTTLDEFKEILTWLLGDTGSLPPPRREQLERVVVQGDPDEFALWLLYLGGMAEEKGIPVTMREGPLKRLAEDLWAMIKEAGEE